MHVSILLFEHNDLLDVGGPYEVLLTAGRLAARASEPAPFEVDTVSLDGEPVTAFGGLGLVPSAPPAVLDTTDILVVPGAVDMTHPLADARLIEAIARVGERAGTTVASVCTGALLLAEAGLLAGRPWTTHWEDVPLLSQRLGPQGARPRLRWVDDGDVVTAAGLSSGIAMGLHLVDRFAGGPLAERTANQLDYEWSEQRAVAH